MPLADKLMRRKRFVIETVLDILKCEMGLEHSRHRSVMNAMVHTCTNMLFSWPIPSAKPHRR
jgi:Transposase DDE domain